MKDKEKKEELSELLKDLVWINGVVAMEIIRISENMAEATRGSETEKCREEHQEILKKIIKVLGKYSPDSLLKEHIETHK